MTSPPDRVCVLKVCLLGLAVVCLPEVVAQPMRGGIRDALIPPRNWVAASGRDWMAPNPVGPASAPGAGPDAERIRALELEVAMLRSDEQDAIASSERPSQAASSRLVVASGVSARLIGDFAAEYWRTRGAIALGRAAGIQESAVVVESKEPLIDAGEKAGVAPHDMVRSGSVVVGMLGEVGVWSSLFRPLVDREFRAGARLARRSNGGLVFAAEGVLQGDGDAGCTLRMITPTEPVQVGDLVVTVERDTGLSEPLVYGEVESADLPENALEWTIRVKPARDWRRVSRVTVIRLEVNPHRMLAN